MFKKDKNNIQYYSETEIINSTRTLSILSVLLFLMFAVLDIWAIPSALSEVFLVRGIVVGCLVITYLMTFSSFFFRYKDYVLTTIFLVTAMGIEYMVFKAKPTDHAYSVYFVGLVLILMTLYSWTYVKLSLSLLITSIVIGGYIYLEMYTRPEEAILSVAGLLANIFFIGAAVVIGIVARLMRDRFMRENYLLQESLKEAYNQKSAEARDNQYLANHDALTDLPNRRHMTELLNKSLDVASEQDKVLVVMFIDLNGFKQVNDVYGHNAGDEVLVIVAKRLELAIRQGDHLSRLGGDEYLMGLMMEKANLGEIEAMASKFIDIISQPMNVEGIRVKIGASIGVAAYPIHGSNIESLIEIADQRMYQAKRRKNSGDSFKDSRDNNKKESVVIFPGNAKR